MSEQDNQNNPSDIPEVEAELIESKPDTALEPVRSLPIEDTPPVQPPLPSTEHLPDLPFEELNVAEVKINKVSDFEPVVRRLIEAQATRVFAKVQDEIAKGKLDKNTYNEIKSVLEMVKLYKDISTPVDEINIKASGHGGRNILAKLFDEILNKKDE